MNKIKQIVLRAGLGQRYYDFWWRRRCPFEPLTQGQIAKGFYFVHIPKTAGTSVLSALGVEKKPYTHCPAHIIHDKYPAAAKNLFFFSVVRDPYARFASSFAYLTKRSDWKAQRQFALDVIGDMDFASFTQKMMRDRSYYNLITGYEFFFPQSYFTHRAGQPLIHETVRFENLNADFNTLIQSRFSDVSALPVLRDHGGGDYRAMYDQTSAALVQRIYAQDFEIFGYDA